MSDRSQRPEGRTRRCLDADSHGRRATARIDNTDWRAGARRSYWKLAAPAAGRDIRDDARRPRFWSQPRAILRGSRHRRHDRAGRGRGGASFQPPRALARRAHHRPHSRIARREEVTSREVPVSQLIGSMVRDTDGRKVGRIEELLARIELHEHGNDYVVAEFHVGAYGLLEALTGGVFAQKLVQ